MLKHLLKTHGVQVSLPDLEDYLEVIKEYNPWFPEKCTLDIEKW